MSKMIKGNKIDLRPAMLADRRMVWEWGEFSDIAPLVQSHDSPHTFEQFCAGWEPHYFMDGFPELGRGFIILFRGNPVGFIAYNDIDSQHRRTELDIWMSCEACCNRGYGPDAVQALCGHLYSQLGVREICMQPSARNPRAVRAYEKTGFQRRRASVEEIKAILGGADHYDSVLMIHKREKENHTTKPLTATE